MIFRCVSKSLAPGHRPLLYSVAESSSLSTVVRKLPTLLLTAYE
jgi:hypothetical protein